MRNIIKLGNCAVFLVASHDSFSKYADNLFCSLNFIILLLYAEKRCNRT